ncbi:MAG: NAD-glutamate dehydrogenase [Arhodomonas sp.]|nr:NAD-glutamate dehydrogenase [Arhodomonas sp.]
MHERERLFALPRVQLGGLRRQPYFGGRRRVSADRQVHQALAAGATRCWASTREQLPPNELIAAILKAPVDLLWNGGIGTYVKASDETHADVGDKANDALRVDGEELRCRVIGEGGNLGVTQLGRVEFCPHGGRVNTDAIDNSGGVDCSDHEVNIKILLNRVVDDGDLTGKQRNELLAEMTDEVARLVLRNNYRQTQGLTLLERHATGWMDEHRRYTRQVAACRASSTATSSSCPTRKPWRNAARPDVD